MHDSVCSGRRATIVAAVSCNCFFLLRILAYLSDNSVEAILHDVKYDTLTKVNAKECAPKLRQQAVMPEKIEAKLLD